MENQMKNKRDKVTAQERGMKFAEVATALQAKIATLADGEET